MKPTNPFARRSSPRRIVAFGGGTGLPSVLRGLRCLVTDGAVSDLAAIVAMSDDGGSSGRLRRSMGMPPPGDVRNCLVSLSASEDLVAALFQHRYAGHPELGGHNLGNLILAALAEQTGSFLRAVEVSSRVLRTLGRILPVTLEDVVLEATLVDGSLLRGESAIGACRKRLRRVGLSPATARATPGVVEAIREAELIVIGPGSLFTSVLPTLVLPEVAEALAESSAVRVLVANLVGERGEAPGLTLEDHVQAIERHAGVGVLDVVLAHQGPIGERIRERYRAEGAEPLATGRGEIAGARVMQRNLLAPGPKLRHDPGAVREGLLAAWREVTASAVDGVS